MTTPIFRFAPSPNGSLHLGHALSALLNWDLALATGGRLLVRLEDIDPERCRPELIQPLLDDLAWLGLEWELPVRRQSQHMADYTQALQRLTDLDLLYPCYASRPEINEAAVHGQWLRTPDGAPRVPGQGSILTNTETARRAAVGVPAVQRLNMAAALQRLPAMPPIRVFNPAAPLAPATLRSADPAVWGDVVLARKIVPTSYHLAVVVDDALQDVTHIVRGTDMEAATGLHRLLQSLLGLPAPATYHHRLLLAADGAKLAKSRGSLSLSSMRAAGVTPVEIRCRAGLPPARTAASA